MTAVQDAPSIMTRLRDDTRALHDAAEKSGFQQALFAGTLPRERFVESLAQLFCVHRALEAHLRAAATTSPAIRAVVHDYQFQEPHLRDDLQHFGRDADSAEPLPAARELIAAIDRAARENPVALLGFHYVLEGSKNGAKFLAERVRRAYNLDGPAGTRSLDPYGPRQRELWGTFRQNMDAVGFSQAEMVAILDAAAATFSGLTDLYNGMYSGN